MAQPNQLNPRVHSIGCGAGLGSTAIIVSGLAGSTAAILAEVGLPANGSIYFGGSGAGYIARVISGVWTVWPV
jgi:hypothetical protein